MYDNYANITDGQTNRQMDNQIHIDSYFNIQTLSSKISDYRSTCRVGDLKHHFRNNFRILYDNHANIITDGQTNKWTNR